MRNAGIPEGFGELARPRQVVVDVHFGGRKIGEALAVASPGTLRFADPGKLAASIPNAIPSQELISALSGELPTHSDRLCSAGNAGSCGKIETDSAAVIFDEDRFQATLFLAPKFLRLVASVRQLYLDVPKSPPSLTSSTGLAVSGSDSTSPSYNLQNRTIVGFRNARLRADSSYASDFGLIVDDLVAELDHKDFRYSGGLFWAPGLDLTGRRRIAGVGLGTQFDTRVDRASLRGTPLVLFLQQACVVELVVDGRLVASRPYEAGNVMLDTSELPDGSYPLLIRIRGQSGGLEEQRRFFVKNAQVAPVGQPLYFAYAGFLANTHRNRPVSISDSFYYQLGTARRLSEWLALDVSAVGAGRKNMVEAGGWLLTRYGRLRLAGLASASGDRAALLQLASSGSGRFNLNLDLRRVWSSDGKPLVPLPDTVDTFGSDAPTGAQVGSGSYTQLSGSLGYAFGRAYVSVVGSLRKDPGVPADYTIGPSLGWTIVSKGDVQLLLQADAQRTRTTSAAYLGFRAQFTRGSLSVLSTLGRAIRRSRDGSARGAGRSVGSMTAGYFHEASDRTQISGSVGMNRNLDSTEARAAGAIHSPLGSARADLIHSLSGRRGLQYALTLQSSAAVVGGDLAIGGRDIEESAIIVSLEGDRGRSAFDVLVNEQPRGRLVAGRPLPIFVQPYKEYDVRLRPVGGASVDYDSATREVTLYPGMVTQLKWAARSMHTVFGQALRPDGRPVANAMVQTAIGIGQTNEHGYFQVDVAPEDILAFETASGPCRAAVSAAPGSKDFASLGKVICR